MFGIIPLYIASILLVSTCFFKVNFINYYATSFCIFFLFKWLTDYRKCTVSYYECKLRGVKKEKGYIYNFMEPIYDVNKRKDRCLFYFIVILIYFINKKIRFGKYF